MSSPGVHTISDMQLGKSISEFLGVWTNPDMVLVICLYFCWLCIYIYTYMHIHIPNFYCVELLFLMDKKGDLMAFDSHFSGEEMQLFWLHIFFLRSSDVESPFFMVIFILFIFISCSTPFFSTWNPHFFLIKSCFSPHVGYPKKSAKKEPSQLVAGLTGAALAYWAWNRSDLVLAQYAVLGI